MNLCKTQILHDSQAHVLFEQMANPTIEIQDFNIIDNHHLMLTTKRTSEDMSDPSHSNVFLASFTTCWACLKLYELLDMLKTRVLYWDTDSVIYTQKEGEIEPPVGDYLGELTNELKEATGSPSLYATALQIMHTKPIKGMRYAKSRVFPSITPTRRSLI